MAHPVRSVPRDCRLHEGQRACFVRQREGDAMVLTTYGRSSGLHRPHRKEALNHFYPGQASFPSNGWLQPRVQVLPELDISKSARWIPHGSGLAEAIAEAAKRADCRSVAFTYNDPVIFAEYR